MNTVITAKKLTPEQKELMEYEIGTWRLLQVPRNGWNRIEMDLVLSQLKGCVIFVTPIPYMIKVVADNAALNWAGNYDGTKVEGSNKHITQCLVMCCTEQGSWYLA